MQEPLTHGFAATPTVCGLFHTMPGHQRVSGLHERGEREREREREGEREREREGERERGRERERERERESVV